MQFLQSFVEENLENGIKVLMSDNIDLNSFTKILEIVTQELDKLEDAREKYGKVFDAILAKFENMFNENINKKIESLMLEYYNTKDEDRKKEIIKQVSKLEEEKNEFIKIAIKNPELLAKLIIDKNIDPKMLLQNMNQYATANFLNNLGEKNPKLLADLIVHIGKYDMELAKSSTNLLTKENVAKLQDVQKNQSQDLSNEGKKSNNGTENGSKKSFTESEEEKKKNQQRNEGNSIESYKVMTKREASEMANTNQIFNSAILKEVLSEKNGMNYDNVKSQMSIQQLQQRGLLKGEMQIAIQELNKLGIKVDANNIEEVMSNLVKAGIVSNVIESAQAKIKEASSYGYSSSAMQFNSVESANSFFKGYNTSHTQSNTNSHSYSHSHQANHHNNVSLQHSSPQQNHALGHFSAIGYAVSQQQVSQQQIEEDN